MLLQINGTEWFNNIAWITGQNSSDSLVNTWFQSKHSHFAFQQAFFVGGASWIFDPSKEAVVQVGLLTLAKKQWNVRKNIQTTSLLSNILAYKNFKSTKNMMSK